MFAKFWELLVRANPGLSDSRTTVRIGVDSLKRQLEKAYDAGHKDGYEKAEEELPDNSVFGSIFGRTLKP